MSETKTDFAGAKLALFIGDALLIYLRDEFDHIPFPGCWDFPGGGREADEDPQTCALRETREEFGLNVRPEAICFRHFHTTSDGGRPAWFFAAHLPADAEAQIRFGDEGQYWRLVRPETYRDLRGTIVHLADLLDLYLQQRTQDD